jgi:hypothetical protein
MNIQKSTIEYCEYRQSNEYKSSEFSECCESDV